MANNVTGRQWFLDTASAVPIWKYNVRIAEMNWVDGVTAGDTLAFQDLSGRVFTYRLNTPNYPYALGKFGWMNGFQLNTITSGSLLVIIDKG